MTDGDDWLAERFEENRARLRAVAYRMLGSPAEADDAVQEAWLRLSSQDASAIDNLAGWLTTVTGRVCLDMLRSRTSRREELPGAGIPEPVTGDDGLAGPEQEALLADSVGLALLVVLDTLAPAERLAFVLHDMFDVPFDEIAPMVGRSPAAARQLASRARRRVKGVDTAGSGRRARQREIVSAFLAASRGGDFDGLLALLDPGAEVRTDQAVVAMGGISAVAGAAAVARTFAGRARGAQLALVDGAAGAVWTVHGRPRVVFAFTLAGERITGIEMIADPDRLRELDLVVLGG
ncbi:MAG TPA: sigma-70 family RNA polymerase sigma factor [Streptosporangiaceae bacterium]